MVTNRSLWSPEFAVRDLGFGFRISNTRLQNRWATRPLPFAVALAVLFATQVCAQNAVSAPAGLTALRTAVWGQVQKPGAYYLSGSPDLMELISSAGGPTSGADLSRLLLIREQDGSRTRIDLRPEALRAEPVFLVPGDVVVVPESFWFKVQRNLPVITTVATVVNLAVTITLLARK